MNARQERPPGKRSVATSADAIAVLKAVASAPFSVGKTGLIRLLEGSIQSRIQGDRSPYFGVLGDLPKAKIDGLIDRLVEDGYLLRDLDHEFKLIRLTRQGAEASPDDLAAYDEVLERPGTSCSPSNKTAIRNSHPRLTRSYAGCRTGGESARSETPFPPYVVAPNATLVEIARRRPGSLGELVEIKGFGPTRVEKYGDEIFAVLGQAPAPDLPDEAQINPMLDSAPLRRATHAPRRDGGGWGPVASPVFKTV